LSGEITALKIAFYLQITSAVVSFTTTIMDYGQQHHCFIHDRNVSQIQQISVQ